MTGLVEYSDRMPHSPLKNYLQESQLYLRRATAALAVVIILMLALVARIAYLQLFQNERYSTLSQHNRLSLLPIPPKRGLIYDRNGILIADNEASFRLDIIPDEVEDLDDTLHNIQSILNLSDEAVEQFTKRIKQHRGYENIPLLTQLTDKDAALIAIHQHQFPGIEITADWLRKYPEADSVAHVVGYVGFIDSKDLAEIDRSQYRGTQYIGKSGIERYYESLLHGTVGYQQVEVDAKRNVVRTLDYTPPIAGKNIQLTIDSRLQEIAYQALKNKQGAVVALNPNNGEILVLISSPSYNPNGFVRGFPKEDYQKLNTSQKPLFNRAIAGRYPPGSTVKPHIGLIGLESQKITPKSRLFDPGWFQLSHDSHRFRNWKRDGHGWVNVESAIIQSSGTFFYDLAYKLGINQLHKNMTQIGFGQLTQIDLPGETAGLMPSPEWKRASMNQGWLPGETILLGIGQGYMLATPLQLGVATGLIATRGTSFRPHLLKQIEDSTESSQANNEPLFSFPVNDPKHWDVIIQAMHQVIYHPLGTAYSLSGKSSHYQMAGKTGTVQVASLGDVPPNQATPKHLRDHSLFVAFAPIDSPEIVIAVIVENDAGAGEVAHQVLDYYFRL